MKGFVLKEARPKGLRVLEFGLCEASRTVQIRGDGKQVGGRPGLSGAQNGE